MAGPAVDVTLLRPSEALDWKFEAVSLAVADALDAASLAFDVALEAVSLAFDDASEAALEAFSVVEAGRNWPGRRGANKFARRSTVRDVAVVADIVERRELGPATAFN